MTRISLRRSSKGARAAACAAGLAAAAFSVTPARAAVLFPVADAEIREQSPEQMRGDPVALPGPSTELAVRVTSGQNTASIMRFDLTGLTSANLTGVVDLRLFSRNAGLGGTNAGGIKIYGLHGDAPLASSWDETTVHYRDAGAAIPVVNGGHPVSQPPPGNPTVSDPTPPVKVTDLGVTPPSWGSDPNAATRAPGLVHENPPYSAAAEQTNETRYNNNLAVRAAYQADIADGTLDGGPYVYEGYVNQPAYMTQSGTAYPDLENNDRPGATVGADLDPNHTSFLGYLNYDAKNPSRPAGTVFSFTTGLENSPTEMGPSIYEANRTSLIAYLTDLLNAGHTDATFLIFQKNAIDGDPLPVRSDNLIFASKEFMPTGGNVGDWAPQLIVPEPSGLALLGVGAAAVLSRSRRPRHARGE